MLPPTRQTGRISEVDEETFWYYLDVLPPQWISDTVDTFCFAEGMEPLRVFWQGSRRYLCPSLTWQETSRFCDLAGMRRDYYLYLEVGATCIVASERLYSGRN